MRRYEAMLDAIRDGLVKKERASIPDDLQERSNHLKREHVSMGKAAP